MCGGYELPAASYDAMVANGSLSSVSLSVSLANHPPAKIQEDFLNEFLSQNSGLDVHVQRVNV